MRTRSAGKVAMLQALLRLREVPAEKVLQHRDFPR